MKRPFGVLKFHNFSFKPLNFIGLRLISFFDPRVFFLEFRNLFIKLLNLCIILRVLLTNLVELILVFSVFFFQLGKLFRLLFKSLQFLLEDHDLCVQFLDIL